MIHQRRFHCQNSSWPNEIRLPDKLQLLTFVPRRWLASVVPPTCFSRVGNIVNIHEPPLPDNFGPRLACPPYQERGQRSGNFLQQSGVGSEPSSQKVKKRKTDMSLSSHHFPFPAVSGGLLRQQIRSIVIADPTYLLGRLHLPITVSCQFSPPSLNPAASLPGVSFWTVNSVQLHLTGK